MATLAIIIVNLGDFFRFDIGITDFVVKFLKKFNFRLIMNEINC